MKKTNDNFFIEVFKFSLITILIVLPFRMYVAKPFIVNGASMYPTFETGHYLIIDQISYRFKNPDRGEVIVFRYPKDPSRFFIKRIIGLPNETVLIKDNQVIIKNSENPSGFVLNEKKYSTKPNGSDKTRKLGENEYFVMGDNRTNSSDSRSWGSLDRDLIIGKALIRLIPINAIDMFPGDFDY